MGCEKDMTTDETRRTGAVDKDAVHLTEQANRNAAVSFCSRLRERTLAVEGSWSLKRARW